MPLIYASLDDVLADVRRGALANESTFRQAFIEALKSEASRLCPEPVRGRVLRVILDKTVRGRRPDVAFANVVMGLEAPPPEERLVSRGKVECWLRHYMRKAAEPHISVTVWGLATNGWRAKLWVLRKAPRDGGVEESIELNSEGPMPHVARHLLRMICSDKIPIITPEDLVALFGV